MKNNDADTNTKFEIKMDVWRKLRHMWQKKLLKDFWLDIYLATAKYQFLVNEKYVIILRKPKL
jgi:hypothetical protein